MKYYQLEFDINLKHRLHYKSSLEVISKFISSFLIENGDDSHLKNQFKYVFSNFDNPKEGFYQNYQKFYLRSFNKKYIDILSKSLLYQDKFLEVRALKVKEVKFRPIKVFMTLNPFFVTIKDGKFWTFRDGDLNFLIKRLTGNLIRKYKFFMNEDIKTDNFIEYLEFKNRTPFKVRYKNREFFGNKAFIRVRGDETSQKLAFIAKGAGLGEKNSLVGGGFLR